MSDFYVYPVRSAEESFGRRIPFAFLEDIRVAFTSTHDEEEVRDAGAYAFNAEFSRVLSRKMELCTGSASAATAGGGGGGGASGGDIITRVQGEICEVKNVMIENIEKVLERGDKIELLVDKTDHLQADAFRFRRQTREVKRNAWWTNAKMVVIVVFVFLFVAYFTTAQFCDLTLSKCVKVKVGGGGRGRRTKGGGGGGAGGSNGTAAGPNSSSSSSSDATTHAYIGDGGRW